MIISHVIVMMVAVVVTEPILQICTCDQKLVKIIIWKLKQFDIIVLNCSVLMSVVVFRIQICFLFYTHDRSF